MSILLVRQEKKRIRLISAFPRLNSFGLFVDTTNKVLYVSHDGGITLVALDVVGESLLLSAAECGIVHLR